MNRVFLRPSLTTARRRVSLTLAVLYTVACNAPYAAMAQQSVSRPGLGVSAMPLEVSRFDAPGFGDLADAVNLANGNVYVEGAGVARNNQGDGTAFGADGWQLSGTLRLGGYSRTMTTLPDRFTLTSGDGSGQEFTRATPDYMRVPSWIRRYQNATPATNYSFYRSAPIPGTTYSPAWLVLVKRGADAVAQHYDASGTRRTFFRDGEYLDYAQSLSQQFRSASASFSSSEGDATGAPRTEFVYTTPAGRISTVTDEYGRTTSYTWNADGLASITYLSDRASPPRSTGFTYEPLSLGNGNTVRVISSMTFNANDGAIGTISRTTGFEYSVIQLPDLSRRVLLSAVKRPAPSGQVTMRYGYEPGGTRVCAVEENRSGPGSAPSCSAAGTAELRTSYTYATSPITGGVQVTVVKTPKTGVAKTSVYHHDLASRLRQRDDTDANADASTSALRITKYGYLRNGSLGSLEEPIGKTTHYVYDDRGNLLKTKVYASPTANPQVVTVGSIRVAAPVTELIAGQSVRIGAFAQGDAAAQGLAWTSSVGSVTTDGTYTAPKPLNGATSVTITAQSKAVPSITAQVTLPLRAITVTPTLPTTALDSGESVLLSADVTNDLSRAGVTWTATSGNIAAAGAGWRFIAPQVATTTAVTLTARSITDPSISATGTITVRPTILTLRAPASSDTTLTAGTAQVLRFAAALENNQGSRAVTWSLTGPGTLSSDGVYTAPTAITAGTSAVVKATSVADATKTVSATITLIPPTMTEILPGTSFYTNAPVQFVVGVNNDTNNAGVTWSITSGGGSINSSGYYTPPVLTPGGSFNLIVRATSVADSRVFKDRTGQVVYSAEAILISAQTYKTVRFVNPYDVTDWEVYPNQKVQLSGRVPGLTYENTFTWTVISGGGSISSDGVYTAPPVFPSTSVVIRATSSITPNRAGTITLLTKQPIVTISGPSTLVGGSSAQLSANVQFDFLGNGVSPVTWRLSGSGTLSPTGLYTRAPFLDTGATITATTASGASGTLTISGLTSGSFPNYLYGPDKYVPGTKIAFSFYFPYTTGTVTWSTTAGTISSDGVLSLPITQTANGVIVTATQGVNRATRTLNNVNLDSGYNSKDSMSGAFPAPFHTFIPPPAGNVERGEKLRLSAIFQGDLLNRGATWSFVSGYDYGTIDSNGVFTAPIADSNPVTFPGSARTIKATARSIAFPDRSVGLEFIVNPTLTGILSTAITTKHVLGRNYQILLDNYGDYSNRGVLWKTTGTGQAVTNSIGVYRTDVFPAPNNTAASVNIEGNRGANVSSISLQFSRINVTLKTPTTTVRPGESLPLSAGLENDDSNAGATYSVTSGIGSVSSTGVYTAPATVAGMSDIPVIVTATSVTDPLSTGSVTLTLQPIRVSITGSSSAVSGQSLVLGNRVENDRTGSGVTWTTSAGSVDANGVLTAPAASADTTVTVTATSKADTTKNATFTVTIKAPRVLLANPVPSGESVTDGSLLIIGAAVLNGTGTPALSVNTGAISGAGGYTLPAPLIAATTTVTANLAGGIGATSSFAIAPFVDPGEASTAPYRQRTYSYDTDQRETLAVMPAISSTAPVPYDYSETSLKAEYTDATAVTVSGQTFTYLTGVKRRTMLGTTEQFRTEELYSAGGLLTQSLRTTANASEERKNVFTYRGSSGTRSVYADQLEQTVETGTGSLTRTTEYTLDALGRTVSRRELNVIAGVVQTSGADETQTRTTTTSYNGFDQVLSQTVSVGASQPEAKTGFTYYASGEPKTSWQGTADNLTTYEYYAAGTADAGRLKTVKKGEGTSGAITKTRETTAYTYDSFGRPTATTLDADSTGTSYDTFDRVVRVSKSDGGFTRTRFDATGAVSQVDSSDPVSGTTLRVTRSNDSFGRASSVTTLGTNAGGATTTYLMTADYDPYDHLVRTTDGRLADVGVVGNAQTSYFKYDSFGRLTAQLGAELSGNAAPGYTDARRPYMEYEYDLLGRKTKERKLLRSASAVTSASLTMPSGATVAATLMYYDAWDRVKQTSDPGLFLTNLSYDPAGNLTGKQQQVCRDATGDCVDHFSDEDGGNDNYATSKYAYDHAGRVVKTTDARGKVSRVRYNDLGLPSSVMDARGITTKVMRYTKDGLLTGLFEPDATPGGATYITGDDYSSDPSGYIKTKKLIYDSERKYPTAQCTANMDNSADVAACGTLEFDYAGRNKLTNLTDGVSSVEQSYNTRGQIVRLKDADGFETLYKYDAFGQLLEEKKPPRVVNTVTNATDSAAFGAGFTGLVSSYAYDKMGNLTQKTEGGLVTQYTYNSLGKVQAETKPKMGAVSTDRKLYTYRVDGAKTAETTYDYAGTLTSGQSNTVDCEANQPNVTAGNAQCWQPDARGLNALSGSFGIVSGGLEKERVQYDDFNGLAQRFKRSFLGSASVYAIYRKGTGASTFTPNHATYWRYDANGNVLKSYKRAIDTARVPTDTLADASEIHEYTFSPTNKEISRTSTVRIWVTPQTTATPLLIASSEGAKQKRVYAPGTIYPQSTTNVGGPGGIGGFTDRDQISQVVVSDRDAQTNEVARRTEYSYYADGSKQKTATYDALTNSTTALGEQTFSYDVRGRLTNTTDSNGIASTFTYLNTGEVSEKLNDNSYTSTRTPTVGGLTALTTGSSAVGKNGCTADNSTTNCPLEKSTLSYDNNGQLTKSVNISDRSVSNFIASPLRSLTTTYFEFTDGNLTKRDAEGTSEAVNGTQKSTQTYARKTVYTAVYDANNAMSSETLSSLDPNATGVTRTYSLSSRGMRLAMNGSDGANPLNGASKRYDAEDRAADFQRLSYEPEAKEYAFGLYVGSKAAEYKAQNVLALRYDPAGNLVLSASATFKENIWGGTVYPDLQSKSNSSIFLDGSVHTMHSLSYSSVHNLNRSITFYLMSFATPPVVTQLPKERDETFSLADGVLNEDPNFALFTPFAAPNTDSSATPLQAPVTPLSTQVRVDPSAIQAPGSNTPPSTDPGGITPPASSTTAQNSQATSFSSGASLAQSTGVSSQNVSSPSVGVQAFSVSSATTTAASTSSNATTASNNSKQVFSSQINLEAPSSVLPPSITPLSASSITSPSSLLIVTPNAGEVSSIVAPGAGVPSVGVNPSSGASTIVPPSGSVNDPTSSVTPPGGSSGAIVPPGGSVGGSSNRVKPLGTYNPVTGKCVEIDWNTEQCDTDKDLDTKANNLEAAAAGASGTKREEYLLKLEEIRLQQNIRVRFGIDNRLADSIFKGIVGSEMYSEDFSHAKNGGSSQSLKFLKDLNYLIVHGSTGRDFLMGLASFMTNYRIGVDQAGRPYFYFTGGPYGFKNGPFAGFNSSELSTYQISFGNLNVYLNGSTKIISQIFGAANPGDIIGFLVASTNGMTPGIRLANGEWVLSKFLKISHGFTLNSYLTKRNPSVISKPTNPCDIGLNAPATLNRDIGDSTKGSYKFDFDAAMEIAENSRAVTFDYNRAGLLFGSLKIKGVVEILAPFGNDGMYDILNRTGLQSDGNLGYGGYYENYGNFLFGAVGAKAGLSLEATLKIQGFGQQTNGGQGNTYKYGTYPTIAGGLFGGSGFYGDDPRDQFWTTRGYEFIKGKCR